MSEERDFVIAALEALEAGGIASVVLRNHEGLPDRIGNDLDLLVAPENARDAERRIVGAVGPLGWKLVNRVEHVPASLYFLHDMSGRVIQVDLFHRVRWSGFEVFPVERLLGARTFVGPHWVTARTAEQAVVLVSGLLYGGEIKQRYRSGLEETARERPDELRSEVALSTGRVLARDLVDILARGDWRNVESMRGRTRRSVILRALRSPGRAVASIASEVARLGRRMARPPGLMIVLLGTDGSGKTTVARALFRELREVFPTARHEFIHWRPTLRRIDPGSRGRVTNPHGRPPRSPTVSVLYLLHHWSRFVVGSWLVIRPALFRNGLVVCDRYYYDLHVDRRRYRLDVSDRLVRLLERGFRGADLVLVLDVEPCIALQRKREVSAEELTRQRAVYSKLAARLPQGHIIDASRPANAVAHEALARVREFLAERALTRSPRA